MFHQSDKAVYIDTHWKKKIYRFQRPPNRNYINEKGGLVEEDDHLIYKFKLKMANTLSVMTNVLRNVVSKQRIRYKENGFDLDLAYICDNIIAMGYPADNLESIYRNRLEDVYKFLEEHHKDHYKIYNLCLERSYDKNKFHGRVAVYPFEDHNPPTIELILKFCNDVDSWLRADRKNVAAVHCKAGKGRTGTMICCYLLYSRQYRTPEEALEYYDSKRTKDRKGVTIPSQRRYVQYFSKLLQSGKTYEKSTLQFCEIRFAEANALLSHGNVQCSVSVLQDSERAVKVETLQNFCFDFRKSFTLDLRNCGLDVTGDIKIELHSKPSRKKIFHFWFNTYFISTAADIEGEGDDAKYIYTLNKCEIDDVHKDKEHKCYPENFQVHLVFYKNAVVRNRNHETSNSGSGSTNRTSSSSNYELSHMQMGGRNYLAHHHNSYPITTAVPSAISPLAISSQLNNSVSNLSYNCDQRSSASSASVSSLVGGGSGSGSASGSDSTKFQLSTENRLKISSNGNNIKLHPIVKSRPPTLNLHRNAIGGDIVLSEDIGTDSLVQSNISDFNSYSIANNLTAKQKLIIRQHHSKQQLQVEQPSENNVAAVVPPSKVSRGSKNVGTQNKNHIIAQSTTTTTTTTSNFVDFDGFVIGNNHLGTNGGGGVQHATDYRSENDHNNDFDNEDIEDEDDDDDDDDEDEDEDWESGESSAISVPHLKAPPINTNTSKDISSNETITQTFHQTTILSSTLPISLNPETTTTTTTTTTSNTHTNNYNSNSKSKSKSNNKLLPISNSTQEEIMCLPSMNLDPLTNTSSSSSSSLLLKTEIGGANFHNDCIRNVINGTAGAGDDDNNDDRKIKNSILGPRQNGNAIMKESFVATATHSLAAAVPPTSRNKFFSFSLNKTRTQENSSSTSSSSSRRITTTTTTTTHPDNNGASTKKPFFRRKSFKTANGGNTVGENSSSIGGNEQPLGGGVGSGGLAPSSKQKLKIKLKKNQFKLAQKFQKLQSYLRNDPDDFVENFAQQTIVRRNSNCSLTNRNHKSIQEIQTKAAHNTTINKISTSPKAASNLQNFQINKLPKTLKKCMPMPSSLDHLTMFSSSSLSQTQSVTASNASLRSSIDCDLGCDCDDYYSSICDNQLSFDNSPCKSPRSLADIALMSGGGSGSGGGAGVGAHHHHHHHHHNLGSANSFNVTQSLSSSLQKRTTQSYQNSYCNYFQNNQQEQRLPFVVSKKSSSRLLKDQQKKFNPETTCGNVVVVAANPAKTHAIGFNVATEKKTQEDFNDCKDVLTAPMFDEQEQSISINTNSAIVNGINVKYNNRESIESENNSTHAFYTPPISDEVELDHDDCLSKNVAKNCKLSPFVFCAMSNELAETISTNNTTTTTTTTSDLKAAATPTRALNLLILKNNSSNTAKMNKMSSVVNKRSPPSSSSSSTTDDTSFESISNGNNIAETGTSSSGLSTGECCTSSSSSNAACKCNPLVFDLERYAATSNKRTTDTSAIIEEKSEQSQSINNEKELPKT